MKRPTRATLSERRRERALFRGAKGDNCFRAGPQGCTQLAVARQLRISLGSVSRDRDTAIVADLERIRSHASPSSLRGTTNALCHDAMMRHEATKSRFCATKLRF